MNRNPPRFYDDLNRLYGLIQSGPGVVEKRAQFQWTPSGLPDTIRRYEVAGSDVQLVATTDYSYDLRRRISRIDHTSDTGQLAFYEFSYDDNNRMRTITDVDGLRTYGYDESNRLISATYPDPARNESYGYDANGNRTGDGYVLDDDNQLTR